MSDPNGDGKRNEKLIRRDIHCLTLACKNFIGTEHEDSEKVWEGLKWKELGSLPVDKKEMIVMAQKALNVWKGGYKEVQD